jgi:hypothetical protein
MLPSPRIPNLWPLLQHFKLVLIYHIDYLLCSAFIIERCGHDCKHFSFRFSRGDGSPLVLLAKCRCSLGHDTGKPCLSKYITACLSSWWFKAHPSYAVCVRGRYPTTLCLESLSDFLNDRLKRVCEMGGEKKMSMKSEARASENSVFKR